MPSPAPPRPPARRLAAAARLGRGRTLAAGLLTAAAPALAGSVALTRFDLWPVLLVALALWALAAGRDALGAALLGLGVAAKLWPGLVLPFALALAWRRGGRAGARARRGGRRGRRGIPFLAAALSRRPASGTRCACRPGGRCRSSRWAPPRCSRCARRRSAAPTRS